MCYTLSYVTLPLSLPAQGGKRSPTGQSVPLSGIPVLIKQLEVFHLAKALEYKGHPLQRKDNFIYYGSFADKYVIMMQILDTKKVKDLDVATKVSVQLQLTDASVKSRDRIVKKTEKDSLYSAIDVAAVWLERALAAR